MANKSGLSIRIKMAIVDAGITQKYIAKLLDVAETTVSAYTKGVSEPPTKNLAAIAKECGVTLDWLITGKEDATITTPVSTNQYSVDIERIEEVIEAVMEHLQNNDLTMPPAKIAELVTVLYEEISETENKQINNGTVTRMIKLAS
ncbi:MAG: helix-turn-helix domain-containing protein [Desulfuromusa sp.]|nr:helix-turn-helix domain-containing protein [Desulfuromusa sp.]